MYIIGVHENIPFEKMDFQLTFCSTLIQGLEGPEFLPKSEISYTPNP